jgi:thiol-disulfide isomerase/thioredoxin
MREGIIILVILLNVFTVSRAQDYHLQFHIEGMQYDSLTLIVTKLGGNDDVFISGKTVDATNWNFVIPDSIYNSLVYFILRSKPKNADINTVYMIAFNTIQSRDTLFGGHYFLDKRIKIIDMKYWKTETYKDQLFRRIVDENKETGENYYYADLCVDHFLIPYFANTDFVLPFTQPTFGYLNLLGGDDNIKYDEYLAQYLKIIDEYPDSRYLTSQVANNLQLYKKKEDLQKLYNAFSETNQQTSYGKAIYHYINNYYTFFDTILPEWNTGDLEPIIQDSTKINLVVFSASWCIPCHEQIPLLKDIYNDLKECIDITYVSEDESKYVDNWRKLMIKEVIPWRSLLAVNDVAAIQKKYNAVGIPYSLLVYPNRHFEVIDVRIKEEKDKLYSLCGK